MITFKDFWIVKNLPEKEKIYIKLNYDSFKIDLELIKDKKEKWKEAIYTTIAKYELVKELLVSKQSKPIRTMDCSFCVVAGGDCDNCIWSKWLKNKYKDFEYNDEIECPCTAYFNEYNLKWRDFDKSNIKDCDKHIERLNEFLKLLEV